MKTQNIPMQKICETEPQKDNRIIAYYENMAIVEDEWGELFYSILEIEFVNIGETLFEEDLLPLNSLPESQQNKVLEFVKKGVVKNECKKNI